MSTTNDLETTTGTAGICGAYSYTFSPALSQVSVIGSTLTLTPGTSSEILASTQLTITASLDDHSTALVATQQFYVEITCSDTSLTAPDPYGPFY